MAKQNKAPQQPKPEKKHATTQTRSVTRFASGAATTKSLRADPFDRPPNVPYVTERARVSRNSCAFELGERNGKWAVSASGNGTATIMEALDLGLAKMIQDGRDYVKVHGAPPCDQIRSDVRSVREAGISDNTIEAAICRQNEPPKEIAARLTAWIAARVPPLTATHVSASKRGRPKSREVEDRRAIIRTLAELKGREYCEALDEKLGHLPVQVPPLWFIQKCPKRYIDAYHDPKWKKRIQDEKCKAMQYSR